MLSGQRDLVGNNLAAHPYAQSGATRGNSGFQTVF
jgi:hypothetical protein